MLSFLMKLAIQNIFLEKIPEYPFFLIYSPLSGGASILHETLAADFSMGKKSEELQTLIASLSEDTLDSAIPSREETVSQLGVLYVIPNFKCNFRCTYCYAAEARNSQEISEDQLHDGIRVFLRTSRCSRIKICFMGGGEPLLSWSRIHQTLPTLRDISDKQIELSVITNGSILNDDFMADCHDFHIQCNVSFDILEKWQEKQRGCFFLVRNNIQTLLDQGIRVRLRATITPDSVHDQRRMIEEVFARWMTQTSLIFEPVISAKLLPDADSAKRFFSDYYLHYTEAARFADSKGIKLQNSFIRALEDVQGRFCRNLLTLLPNGQLIRCPCFASPDVLPAITDDSNYMGKIAGDELTITESGRKNFLPTVNRFRECETCIAKWHCAGGCEHNRREYSPEIFMEICRLMRRFTMDAVMRKLDVQYRSRGYGGIFEIMEKSEK